MDNKQKLVKQVYVHKVANTLKVEPGQYSPDGTNQSVLHYKRLVVPANMRSIYWKCYGFPASDDNEILTRSKIVCLLCKSQMTYNRNTTNLRMHLQNKHKTELESLEVVQPLPSSKAGKVDKRSLKRPRKPKSEQPVVQVYPLTNDEQNSNDVSQYVAEIDDMNPLSVIVKEATSNQSYSMVDGKAIAEAIAEFIVLDLQNPEIVEGNGFQKLVGTLKSPVEIPKKNYLTEELIPNIYDVVKEQVYCEISALHQTVSLSIEDWVASTGETYSTLAIHYISQARETELQSRVLGSIYCSDVDPDHWGVQFDMIIEEYKIQVEKVRAVVVSSDREDVYQSLQLRGHVILPCFSYLLQSICSQCVFERKEVDEVLKKCRAFIAHVSRNSTASAELRLQDNLLQIEENPILMDNKASWMSTLTMLEQMQARKGVLASILDCLSGIICPTSSLELTETDWSILDDVVNILSPLKVTIATLVEEKSPLVSILKPILCQLLNVHLDKNETDTEFAVMLKDSVATFLNEKYKGDNVKELIELAAALDPRFKNLPFLTEENRVAVRNKVVDLLRLQTPESGSNEGDNPSPKKRVSGMEYLLGELVTVKSEMPSSQKADLELVQYEWEPQANLERSPIEWWRETNGKCYQIYRLAIEYLCVPICVKSHLQQTLNPAATLQSVSPQLAVKMKFLNTNYGPSE